MLTEHGITVFPFVQLASLIDKYDAQFRTLCFIDKYDAQFRTLCKQNKTMLSVSTGVKKRNLTSFY